MTDKLYIIGNGFDLHHELRTSYADFRDDYVRKVPSLWNALLDIYDDVPRNDDLWWKDFENMLGKVDYDCLSKSRNGESLGFMKVRNLFKGKLPPLFGTWINDVNSQIDASKTELMDEVDADSLFFTFNYTLLLEKAYHVKEENVWHIHGTTKNPDNIIVGHDADPGQLVKYMQEYNKGQLKILPSFADAINQETLKGAKKVKDRINHQENNFYHYYSGIKHFISMGFSFNNIDMPYIEKIVSVNKNISEADWTLYWHTDGEFNVMKDKLLKLGIDGDKIKLKKW